jgi:NAD(P)H-dependent FMN reductase
MIARSKTLLIVYHSMTGGTRQMAQAAAGAAVACLAPAHAAQGQAQRKLPEEPEVPGEPKVEVEVEAQVEVQVRVLRAPDAHAADVLAADAYLFATPENLGAMSGLMKDFFDRCYYPALDRVNGRPYASMICAGSDGSNAARQLERIATGWRLEAVAPALIICTHAQTPEQIGREKCIDGDALARCADLGACLAAGLEMGIY